VKTFGNEGLFLSFPDTDPADKPASSAKDLDLVVEISLLEDLFQL